jgi:outer membrane protein OmpA-like peptidoglycan-associated protein
LAFAMSVCPGLAYSQQSLTPEDIISNLGGQPKSVDDLAKEDIVSALTGRAPAATSDAGNRLFEKLKKTRSFTIKDREEVQKFSKERPKVSIEVYFDYNSAEITPQARLTLDKLGVALEDPRLAGKQFIFRGHTDARGDPNYNLRLSDRRADAAKHYIVRSFRVDERNITSIGNGARELKNPDSPFADENRRVEVVRPN